MKKKYFLIILAAVVLFLAIFFLRMREDVWVCQSGEWVKHGNPSAPKPNVSCDKK